MRAHRVLGAVALGLLGILALSFLIPSWTASTLGLAAPHALLIGWILRQQGLAWLLLLLLYGVSGAENGRRADAVCTGLQLTNFWQDIAVDWHKGRVYLPGEDLARFGVAEEEIAAGRCDERWERLLAFECERARALLESGHALTGALPLRLALELKLIINGGLRILRAIDAVHGDVFRHRPRLRGRDWLAMATRTLVA